MKCYEIRFDTGNVMFVRDSALAESIKQAVKLAGAHCDVRMADIGDDIIAPVRNETEPMGYSEEAKSPYLKDRAWR